MLRGWLALLLLLYFSGAQGDWSLDPQSSSLSFVTVKNGKELESHRFNALTGNVDLSGHAEVRVTLASVHTANPLLDGRLEQMVFESDKYPMAVYAVDLQLKDITLRLKPGDAMIHELAGVLNLHGITRDLLTNVHITRLTDDAFQITSREAIVISASDFNLSSGLRKIMDIAKLDAIAPKVAVSFSLVFREYEFLQN